MSLKKHAGMDANESLSREDLTEDSLFYLRLEEVSQQREVGFVGMED